MKPTVFLTLLFYLIVGGVFSQQSNVTVLKKLFYHAEEIQTDNPDSALLYYKKILTTLNYNKTNELVAMCYLRMGTIYGHRSDLQNAFKNYMKLLECGELIKDTSKLISAWNNLGITLSQQRQYPQAIAYIKKSIEMSRQSHNYWQIMNSLVNIADMMGTVGKIDSSIIVLKEAESIAVEHHFEEEIPNILANLGNVYYGKAKISGDKKFFRVAAECAQEAIDRILNMKNPKIIKDDYRKDLAYSYGLKGAALAGLENYNEAEAVYQKAIAFYIEQQSMFDLSYLYFELTNVYMNANQNKKAALYLERYDSISKALYTKENTRAISDMQTKYETEKKDQQNQVLKIENRLSAKTIKQQKIISYCIIIGLALSITFAYFIFKGLKKQKQANSIISNQKKEVEKQKELVDEKQKEILDSIHYAKRIQNTLLAHKDFLNENLSNNFVLFKPKDIVSGDFYWATKAQANGEKLFYLAVCDSTGHGVPGAFMSLLNIGFLSEAIKEKDIFEPHRVFNYVRKRLIESISKEEQKDGFDGILLCINKTTGKITYAAANNNPVIVSNNTVINLKADKMPVGKGERENSFTLFDLELLPNDTLYLFTDGYPDQFGGPKGKKFKYKQLEELLINNTHLPLNKQALLLENVFDNWKGNLEQIDDVLVVGLKLR